MSDKPKSARYWVLLGAQTIFACLVFNGLMHYQVHWTLSIAATTFLATAYWLLIDLMVEK
jgi:hypothetical protein